MDAQITPNPIGKEPRPKKKIFPEDVSHDGVCWVGITKYHWRQARQHVHGPMWGQEKANQKGIVFPEKNTYAYIHRVDRFKCLFWKCWLTRNAYHLINKDCLLPSFPRLSLHFWIYSLIAQKHSEALDTSYAHLKRKGRISARPSTAERSGHAQQRRAKAVTYPRDITLNPACREDTSFLGSPRNMGYFEGSTRQGRGDLTPRRANPAAGHQWLPEVLRVVLVRSCRPRPHPVALMEQIPQGFSAAAGGSVNPCAGTLGCVMVDQNLTGDHGGGRKLGWAPGPLQFTSCTGWCYATT